MAARPEVIVIDVESSDSDSIHEVISIHSSASEPEEPPLGGPDNSIVIDSSSDESYSREPLAKAQPAVSDESPRITPRSSSNNSPKRDDASSSKQSTLDYDESSENGRSEESEFSENRGLDADTIVKDMSGREHVRSQHLRRTDDEESTSAESSDYSRAKDKKSKAVCVGFPGKRAQAQKHKIVAKKSTIPSEHRTRSKSTANTNDEIRQDKFSNEVSRNDVRKKPNTKVPCGAKKAPGTKPQLLPHHTETYESSEGMKRKSRSSGCRSFVRGREVEGTEKERKQENSTCERRKGLKGMIDNSTSKTSDKDGLVAKSRMDDSSDELEESVKSSDVETGKNESDSIYSDSADRKPAAKKRRKTNKSPTKRSESMNSESAEGYVATTRCPICFHRYHDSVIDVHMKTCGKAIAGTGQRNNINVASPFLESGKNRINTGGKSLSTQNREDSPKAKSPFSYGSYSFSNDYFACDMPTTAGSSSDSDISERQEASTSKKLEPNSTPVRNVTWKRGWKSNCRQGAKKSFQNGSETPHESPGKESRKRKAPKLNGSADSRSWRNIIEDALRQVRQDRIKFRNESLAAALRSKNELLSTIPEQSVLRYEYPLLGSLVEKPLDSSYMNNSDYPIPRDNFHTVFLKKQFASTDEKTDDSSENDSSLSDKKRDNDSSDDEDEASKKQQASPSSPGKTNLASKIAEFNVSEKIGIGFEEVEVDEEIDQVLKDLEDIDHSEDEVLEYLATLLQEDVKRVRSRYERLYKTLEAKRLHETPYENVMSSFRDLFCRRCLSYDCNIHGLAEDYSPKLQADLAIRKEASGFWQNGFLPLCLPVSISQGGPKLNVKRIISENGPVQKVTTDEKEMTENQKVLCQKLWHVFQGDLTKVSTAMGVSEEMISSHVALEPLMYTASDSSPTNDARGKQTKSNTYNPNWIKRIVETRCHPFFTPCHHTEPCSESTCSCIQNGFFCSKACIWGSSSRNFFRGCNCSSRCTAKNCPCFASNRECDPDLCQRCGACTDPPNKPGTNQACRNDNISMRRHVHLLLGKSKVAGWGLFTKYPLKKGDYIHEYLGEVIPQDEAERRGVVYDKRNQTYLFDLSTDCAVDALRKGNKTRFINHSANPNIAPQMKVINGDYRIGFFAKRDIPAQAELFFDYGRMFFSTNGGFAKPPPQAVNYSLDQQENDEDLPFAS